MTTKKELGFDVMPMPIDSYNYVIVAYEAGDGQTRIRVANDATRTTPRRFGGESPISGISNLISKDIQFYHAQSTSTDEARALWLDTGNSMVWDIHVNTVYGSTSVPSTFDAATNGTAVGAGAISMVQNSTHTRAYVLNSTDFTVSVITLVKTDGTVRDLPAVVATVNLSDVLPGKTLTFSPTTLQYKDGYLLVGDANLKSNLVINTSSITETTVADSTAAAVAAGRTVTGSGSGGATFTIPGTHITVTPGAIGTHTHTRIHR